jgi:xylan 1,4-beta-xylosidase
MRYRNPVIPGFNPDPSICRVGDDYFLVTSTFEWFPGVPIYHSRDLVHWRHIGHCLTRDSQLPLQGCRSSGGIYAPTIRHHQGRFHMVTTNVTGGGNFYVHSDDPAGEWSEPIWVAQGGIDPSFFFEDGRTYLASTGPQGIQQSEIDLATGELLSEPRMIWPGTGGRFPEAPHLYKIDGAYYLMIAEGGTEYGHVETIARSDSLWGPFESCPHNPILTHRNRGRHPIQGTGHADLIQAGDGSWWLVCLAFRSLSKAHHLGRETYLAPVTWTDDGWPVVNGDGTIEIEMEADGLLSHPWPSELVRDEFDSPTLGLAWNHLRNPDPANYSLSERPGWLRIKGSALRLDDVASPAFVARRQQHMRFRAATLLEFDPQCDGDEAGLVVFMNERHHYEVAVTRAQGERCVLVRRRIGDLQTVVARRAIGDGPIILEIRATESEYVLSAGFVGEDLTPLATGATRYLATEIAGGFTGVYVGVYATGNGQSCRASADFDWFDYSPDQSR